jgi:lysozyme
MNLIGTDISFYQDDNATPAGVNFVTMKNAGAGFVIIRAGQNNWVDPDFAVNWMAAKAAGIPRGSYWYYDSRVTPQSQANLYVASLGGDYGELPLFADFEENYGGPYGGWQNFKFFIEAIKAKVNRQIGIYTAYYYWNSKLSGVDRTYFHQYPLWIANYGSSAPLVPLPWSPSEWLFWQFSSTGDGRKYGTESAGIDLNYFNGDAAAFRTRFKIGTTPPPTPPPVGIPSYDGVTVHQVERFGAKCIIHIVDTLKARVYVTSGGFMTVSQAVARNGAQIGVNAGGWNSQGIANEIWVSGGITKKTFALDNRPYINIARNGRVIIHVNDQLSVDNYNAWGFDRLLGRDGVFNSAISDRVTKDARTGSGVTADGKLIILSAEGNDLYRRGLTFPEMWGVMREFGAVTAGNNDGGSSSACVNLALSPNSLIIPSDGNQAYVINHVLIFAGTTPAPGEIKMIAKTLGGGVALWYDYAGIKTGKLFPANTEFEYIEFRLGWYKLANGLWMNGGQGKYIVQVTGTPEPPPPPPPTTTQTYIVTLHDNETGENFSGILEKV